MPNMKVGDWLIFGGLGSYTVGPVSNFNGMKVQNKIAVWNEKLSKTVVSDEIFEQTYNATNFSNQKRNQKLNKFKTQSL